jgi:predicted ATP-binding protein involved in virulence
VIVDAYGAHVPLEHLSDGYQSVVAMTVDILQAAMQVWPNLQDAEGTVLLDEMGAHLHPRWKMRIVGALRNTLPGMQFLATTHDPLCLRGLGEGEVAVLRRDPSDQVISVSGLPSPADFRVDQLLASDFFGLSSTIDPETEAIFDEYYALLALKNPTAAQTKRLTELRDQLKNRRYLGTTLREGLMFDAIDKLVASHRADPTGPISDLKKEAVDEVSTIWSETTS